MIDPTRDASSAHALCVTRAELVVAATISAIGIGVSMLHELLFGPGGAQRILSTLVDALQGSLFWSVVVIVLSRVARAGYRMVRGRRITPAS